MLKLEDIERAAILERLELLGGNRTKTAKSLNIGLRTLQRKLREYGTPILSNSGRTAKWRDELDTLYDSTRALMESELGRGVSPTEYVNGCTVLRATGTFNGKKFFKLTGGL